MEKNCASSWLFTKVKVIFIFVAGEFLNLTPELLQGVCCALRPLFCPYDGDSRSFEKGETQNMLSYNTSYYRNNDIHCQRCENINPLNSELNPICHLLALLGAQLILHISRIRVKSYNVILLSRQMIWFYCFFKFIEIYNPFCRE